jgi:hypothetical protein
MLPKIRSEIERDFSSMPSRFYFIFGVLSLSHQPHTFKNANKRRQEEKQSGTNRRFSSLFFFFFPLLE